MVGSAGQSTPLTFTDYTDPGGNFHPGFAFNEGEPPAVATNGSACVNPTSISGRVVTSDGRGIVNAQVVVTGDSLRDRLVVITGSLGYFSFDGLARGETYVVTVNAIHYTFRSPSRVVSLASNISDTDFVADP